MDEDEFPVGEYPDLTPGQMCEIVPSDWDALFQSYFGTES